MALRRSALWSICVCVSLAGCGYEVVTGRAMGTSYAVTADCPQMLPDAALKDVLATVDERMSTYRPDSELMRFNQSPVGVWAPVSAELVDVVAAAKAFAEETGGAFDPTVAPLVALWGFGASPAKAAPTAAAIAEAMSMVGQAKLQVRRSPPALAKAAPLALDLSGIAKGHAVDRMAQVLVAAGCTAFLVEFGGEVRARGRSPSGGAWRVGIESPTGDGHLDRPIQLRDGALATSGDYRQYREVDGVRHSHIIDPRSGHPIRHRLAAVTVAAPTARTADAYATALMVLGEREGLAFADRTGLAALFVVRREDGFETIHSTAFGERHSGRTAP